MATLSRSRSYNPFELSTSNNRDGVDEYDQGDITLHSGVPTPFPSHLIPTQSVPDEPAIAPTETVDTELVREIQTFDLNQWNLLGIFHRQRSFMLYWKRIKRAWRHFPPF
jgi:hypothetical protein